jgi:WD40 repeat protein
MSFSFLKYTYLFFQVWIIFLSCTQSIAQSGHTGRILALAMNTEGKLLSSSVDGKVILWNENGKKITSFSKPTNEYTESKLIVTRLQFLKNNTQFIASSLMEGYIGNVNNPSLTSLKTGYISNVFGLSITANDQYLLVAHNNYSGLSAYDLNGIKQFTIPTTIENIYPFQNDSSKFITTSVVSGLTLFNTQGTVLKSLPLLKENEFVAISPTNTHFSYANTIYHISGKALTRLTSTGENLLFSKDGKTIYTFQANTISFWSLGGKLIKTISCKNSIQQLITTPDGNNFIIGNTNGTIEMVTLEGASILNYE